MTCLRSVFDRSALHAILRGLDSGERVCGVIHPNGFLRIMIAEVNRKEVQFRIHLWRSKSSDGDIHNHCWSFASVCIHGGLRMKRFRLNQHGSSYDHYACRSAPSAEGRSFVLTRLGTDRLAETSTWCIQAGDAYEMDPDELHKIELDDSSTDDIRAITLVRRGRYVKSETDLYLSPASSAHTGLTLERRVEPAEIAQEIAIVKDRLKTFLMDRMSGEHVVTRAI